MPEPLRIAQVAPLANPVRREIGSSIEQLVWLLTGDLVERSHEVTLFASGDSETSAELRAFYPRSYGEDPALWDAWEHHELVHLGRAFEKAEDFDVIHSHVYHFAPPFARITGVPTVHTSHIPVSDGVRADYARYPEARVVAVSRYEAEKFGDPRHVPVVYNGIDTGSFPFGAEGGDYLVFLGHLIERKGPVEAIRVAREAGMPLVLAGKGSGAYFEREVEPLIDGEEVRHVGVVDARERDELLAGAGALVFTSLFAEPFGLVMVEAMACGTPVLALERCAVPEVVDRGATGCYAADPASLAALVPEALALDRAHVREQATKRFDYRRMTTEYEGLYRSLVEGEGRLEPRELA